MDSEEKRLEILDSIINMDITVDDLRRILMLFRYVNYQMESDDESNPDFNDEALQSWLEYLYNESLKTEGIVCF
jgi:hypothetical protein